MRDGSSTFTPPTLENERVKLRPLTPEDYRILFEWHSEPGGLHLWWADRQLLSFEEFVINLQRRLGISVHVFLMVEMLEEERRVPVGVTYTYNTNLIDRFTYVCMYLTSEFSAESIGPKAEALFVDYLFSCFGFRKIYAEIFGYDKPSLKAALSNGFREEGCLREHRWLGDRYWDLHVLSISRERFEDAQGKRSRRVSYGHDWLDACVSISIPAPEEEYLRSRLLMPYHAALALSGLLGELGRQTKGLSDS